MTTFRAVVALALSLSVIPSARAEGIYNWPQETIVVRAKGATGLSHKVQLPYVEGIRGVKLLIELEVDDTEEAPKQTPIAVYKDEASKERLGKLVLGEKIRQVRLLFFGAKTCSGCVAAATVLADPDIVSAKWTKGLAPTNHIQLMEEKEYPSLIEQYNIKMLPAFILVDGWEEIGRVDPDVEGWNPYEFIRLGAELYNSQWPVFEPPVRQRPVTEVFDMAPVRSYTIATASPPLVPLSRSGLNLRSTPRVDTIQRRGYPVRGQWWTGCPSWRHMTTGEHRGKFNTAWLRSLSYAELQSLHSDDHEHRVKWAFVPR